MSDTRPRRIDADLLTKTLDRLRDIETGGGLVQSLAETVDAIVAVFGVDGAGLMFVDDKAVLRYVAASDRASAELERAQEELGHGPCVDSLLLAEVVTTADLAIDPRWPGLAGRVVPRGVVAVLGVPVRLGGQAVGSLNVYFGAAHEWDGTEIDALHSFTTVVEAHVGAAVLARRREELVETLQQSLDHRVTVERAVGLLMGREGLDEVEAYKRLRALAAGHPIHEAAAAVLGDR